MSTPEVRGASEGSGVGRKMRRGWGNSQRELSEDGSGAGLKGPRTCRPGAPRQLRGEPGGRGAAAGLAQMSHAWKGWNGAVSRGQDNLVPAHYPTVGINPWVSVGTMR